LNLYPLFFAFKRAPSWPGVVAGTMFFIGAEGVAGLRGSVFLIQGHFIAFDS
jgi:hypothetical protein